MVLSLEDEFLRRSITRLVYVHCDHWEPWKSLPGLNRTKSLPFMVERIAQFAASTAGLDFAQRLTLFYKPGVHTALDTGAKIIKGVRAHPDDRIVFHERPQIQISHGQQALGHLLATTQHAIEVHVHHEGFTHNHKPEYAETGAYLASREGRAHEEARFDLGLRLILHTIRQETGLPLDRWFFVHGHWALQASDPDICHLVRETQILAANGCRGDFTFPAGRASVNPRLEVPYLVTPVAEARGYDLQMAMPELAYGNAVAAQSKFFIWASQIKHRGSSLDYYAPWVRTHLEDPVEAARLMIRQSYAAGSTLFIKTHAHSMHPAYFIEGQPPAFPLAEPAVRALFGRLFEAAAKAGVGIELLSAAEVYDDLIGAAHTPADGYALTIPGSPADTSTIDPPPPSIDLGAPRPGNPWGA